MTLQFSWHPSIDTFTPAEWNRLAEPLTTPFLEWHWLAALEQSGCVRPELGWQPLHLGARREGRLVAAAALYAKGHSRGEFVFDQEWAEAAARLGQAYYPKLVGMTPFTPAPGYRFLIDPAEDERELCGQLQAQIDALCRTNRLGGCHYLHTDPAWAETMKQLGLGHWQHHQLIWENPGHADFDAYLGTFDSKQRKNIRRERRLVREQGFQTRLIQGSERPELFPHMYQLYADTCQKFWNWSHYLNQNFFERLALTYGARVLFAVCERDASALPPAMAFLIHKGDQLYGRHWGDLDGSELLHFEACYYQPIEWAIAEGVRRFDAGSGSARHKQRRGFPALPGCSLHRFYSEPLNRLWRANIDQLNAHEAAVIAAINGATPSLKTAETVETNHDCH